MENINIIEKKHIKYGDTRFEISPNQIKLIIRNSNDNLIKNGEYKMPFIKAWPSFIKENHFFTALREHLLIDNGKQSSSDLMAYLEVYKGKNHASSHYALMEEFKSNLCKDSKIDFALEKKIAPLKTYKQIKSLLSEYGLFELFAKYKN